MTKVPMLLIWSRLLAAIAVPIVGYYCHDYAPRIIVSLMVFGLLTDVFDGVIARRMGVATEKLRIYDSNVDLVFWIAIICTAFALNGNFYLKHLLIILIVLMLEIICYGVALLKFRKTVATHTLLAKMWTLSLIVFLVDLILNGTSIIPFWVCIGLGIISRIEIILILMYLKKWITDIPSLLAIRKINNGLAVKKNKLFN